jgi:hypothetical protein
VRSGDELALTENGEQVNRKTEENDHGSGTFLPIHEKKEAAYLFGYTGRAILAVYNAFPKARGLGVAS